MSEYPPKIVSQINADLVMSIEGILIYDEKCKYKYLQPEIRQRLLSCYDYFNCGMTPKQDTIVKVEKDWQMSGTVDFQWKCKSAPKDLPKKQFQSAIVPVLEDFISGKVTYHGWDEGGGYLNIYLSGSCPIHKRFHDGGAWKWVLKQKMDDSFAGFKCWRDESFKKIASISQLL